MRMFTAVIRVRQDASGLDGLSLAATLGPLVRGVVQGVVGSALLVACSDHVDLHKIADSAGCRVVIAPTWPEGFARAVAMTGGAPLIVMDTGVMLGQEFWPVLADHLPLLNDRPAATLSAASSGLFWGLLRPFRQRNGRVEPDCALLLPISTARTIAQKKIDPWAYRYGAALVRLNVQTTRLRPV